MKQVFVATDVGVFTSPTSSPNWIELGPNPNTDQAGFLPNVAVTALGIFNSGQQLLRASTYGRGIWQFNLVITPDFNLSVSNSPLTVFMGQTATFNGNISALNGYTNTVTLSCSSGTTAPPSTCTPSPSTLTPGNKTPFTVTAGGAAQDYSFNVKAVRLRFQSCHTRRPCAIACHQLRHDGTFACQCDGSAGHHLFARQLPDHCCGIIQSKCERFLHVGNCRCSLLADTRPNGESDVEFSGEYDCQRRSPSGYDPWHLPHYLAGINDWSACPADEIVQSGRHLEPGFRSQLA